MFKIPILPAVRHILKEPLDERAIFRMGSLQHQFQCGLRRVLAIKNSESLI
jgi:hypothetical protein